MTHSPEKSAGRRTNEQAVQRFIGELIKNNALLEAITGKESVVTAAARRRGPGIIPTLSIDSLQRDRIILAADEALTALSDIEIISGDTSISRSPGEILRPDFVLFNRSLGRIILVELKDDKQPERQAVTELLAYERELRNHFPFMGGMEVVFVLVARDWSNLLNHAYAALAMRGRPSLLALTVSGEEPDFKLEVRTDEAWYRIFELHIAPEALCSRSYRVRFHDQEEKVSWLALNEAAHLMRQAADRAGQHGFSYLWEDPDDKDMLGITLYAVDPAHLHIPVDPINPTRESSFSQYFEALLSSDTMHPEVGLEDISTPLRQTLYGRAVIEHIRDGSWVEDLVWLKDQGVVPTGFQYWGLIADFSVRIGTSEAARRHFLLDGSIGVEGELAGLQIITAMTGTQPFPAGMVGARSLFDLGRLLGRALALIERHPVDKAAWFWVNSDLALHNVELTYLAESWIEPSAPSEPLHLFAAPDANAAANTEVYIDWLRHEINDRALRLTFEAGLVAGSTGGADPASDLQTYQRVCLELIQAISQHTGTQKQWTAATASLPDDLQACLDVNELYHRMSSATGIERWLPLLIEVVDSWIPPLRRRQRFIIDVVFDVEELRRGINNVLVNLPAGKLPCILIGADGMIGTSVIDLGQKSIAIDHSTQVAVLNRSSGRNLVTVLDWCELSDGTLGALRSNMVGQCIELSEWPHGPADSVASIDNAWLGGTADFGALGLHHPGPSGARFFELSLSEDHAPEIAILINTANQPGDGEEINYFIRSGILFLDTITAGFVKIDLNFGASFEKHTLLFDPCVSKSRDALSRLRRQSYIHFVHCDLNGNVLAVQGAPNVFEFAMVETMARSCQPGTRQADASQILSTERSVIIDVLSG